MWHLCFCRRSNRIQIRNVPAHVPKEELDRLVTTFGNPQKCDIGRLCLHTRLSSKNNCWPNCVPRETDWSYRWLASVLKSSVFPFKELFKYKLIWDHRVALLSVPMWWYSDLSHEIKPYCTIEIEIKGVYISTLETFVFAGLELKSVTLQSYSFFTALAHRF